MGPLKKKLEVWCGHKDGALIQYVWCPWKRANTRDARAKRRGLGRNQLYWSLDLVEDVSVV